MVEAMPMAWPFNKVGSMSYYEHEVAGHPDVELGLCGERQVRYRIHGAEQASSGLVVYIPGFGGDLGAYSQVFCEKVAAQHGMAALCVDYFCMRSRPAVGAVISLLPDERVRALALLGLPATTSDAALLRALDTLQPAAPLRFHGLLIPPDGAYQNFGVMAALDILNAIEDAMLRYGGSRDNLILVGSSYGGYLAQLVNKFRPGYVRALFDNSSWAEPNLAYVVGRDIGAVEYQCSLQGGVELALCVDSPWRMVAGHPHEFDVDAFIIRAFSASQLDQMAAQGGTQTFCLMVHAIHDAIAPADAKLAMARAMLARGFNAELILFDESSVDGEFIRNMEHGMGLSMLQFFEQGLALLAERSPSFVATHATEVTLHAGHSLYHLNFAHPQVRLQRQRIEGMAPT
ncbi:MULTISPECIES: DUF2920 family protein [Aeromonas]|uniref:DUF2920 family protein n=1 Tax=Aeromonas TaxID=642 RepID=UPI001396B9B4